MVVITWVALLVSMAGIILGMLAVPLLIFFLVKAHGEQDLSIKKKYRRKALWSVLTPFILIFSSVILYAIVSIIKGS